ncbi:MAG: glycosyl hydrolase 115 family protein [Bacteroidales bacterium]|nr:glycosyl hydrolase 115 family protein [Bacteroidales bacterium]
MDSGEDQVVHTAVALLRRDVERVLGASLRVTDQSAAQEVQIIAGTLGRNPEIDRLMGRRRIDVSAIKGKWEAFLMVAVPEERLLCIAGSDSRGTAYGLLELSRMVGVSPWHYFADVTPDQADRFPLPEVKTQQSPSVRYRGVFLNDEDWGWMPWATQTLTPASAKGAVGPEAYEKLFEILLRLRANTVWPAMHECTVPFYLVKGNKEMADKYGIVVGTSHCEPMLRCSASEWDLTGKGDYNYVTNRNAVIDYWTDRLKELKGSDNIYTIGMRGKHDGMMQGVRTQDEHKLYLTQIIRDQQELIRQYVHPDPSLVTQAFIPYKEVLEVYDAGLEVPDYVTLVWCDDNYGYIRRLSNDRERLRSGGSGVYYHISYWGRPHDYLWLASTSPALVHAEMKRAYQHGADKMWILNVGDLKPAEYLTEFFMDMAWNIRFCEQDGAEQSVFEHLKGWAAREFGKQSAAEITSVMKSYYRLANIRKPEHMGWSRVEESGYPRGLTPVTDSEYNPEFNDELQRRIRDYLSLEERVRQLKQSMPENRKSAFFQLVEYPVRGASLMNRKWLYAQLAHYYADTDSRKAKTCADESMSAYHEIERITDNYSRMENGKWQRMMDFQPRKLPVFAMPEFRQQDSLPHGGNHAVVREQSPQQGFAIAQNAVQSVVPRNGIEGLGHSFAAVPLPQHDSLRFTFNVPREGDVWIKVAAIPNHDVDGQGMKIAVYADGTPLPVADYSVEGRSEAWKQNVLRGQAITVFKHRFAKAGNVTITVKALTPHVIIDQIMLDTADARFYEFPAKSL